MAKHLLPELTYAQTAQACAAAIRSKRTVAIEGSPGIGKCFGEGTPVLLADGRVLPVEQIVEGDRLMGPDGNARVALSTTTGRGPLYRIDPIKGEPWVCNDVHVLTLVHTNTGEIIDIPLNEYLDANSTFRDRHKQFSVGVEAFEGAQTKLPIDPYFLGAWFGGGHKTLSQTASGIQHLAGVALSKNDPEILALCEETARVWDLRVRTQAVKDKCLRYCLVTDKFEGQFRSNRLLQTLRDTVGPRIEVPDMYRRSNREARLQFLAGYVDTDGELASNCFSITQKREDWARSVWWIARSLGFCATIAPRIGRCPLADGTSYEGRYWVVIISGHVDQIPTRLPRKTAEPRQQRKVATRTGFRVTALGHGDYYGFTLNRDGRFLLGDFTVTHNTAVVRDASRAVGMPCYDCVASNLDPTDVAGLPYRDENGHVKRELFPEIRAVCDAPGVLFVDEATTMPKSVEGPMLRVALERNAGGTPLHDESAVLIGMNAPEECPGGIDFTAAMVNRVILIRYQPSFEELAAFFNGEPVVAQPNVLSEEAYAKQVQLEMADFAATITHDPSLFIMKPPRASIDAGEPWGSPRAWEIGLSAYASLGLDMTAGVTRTNGKANYAGNEVGFALLAGAVGAQPAAQYLAIRSLRQYLPSMQQICKQPMDAPVPPQTDHQIAALGVLARVADTDVWASWTYANRLQAEIGAACARVLMNKPPKASPHATTGLAAQVKLLARIKKATR